MERDHEETCDPFFSIHQTLINLTKNFMHIKKTTFIVFFLLVLLNSFKIQAQNNEKPPTPSITAGEKTKLIDEIINISGFKAYYVKYCKDVIDEEAVNRKWSASKIKEKKNKVKFADFDFIAHNSFSSLSVEALKEMIGFLKKINADSNDYFFGSYLIIDNLKVFARGYLRD